MTSPADDCGVSGGCRACPLFAANVCGDPAPEPRTGPLCGSCDAGLPMACACPPPARFEVDAAGVTTDREAWSAWAPIVDAYLKAALADLAALAAVDPDAPDVDPAEPKPEGAGCCGGKCASPC